MTPADIGALCLEWLRVSPVCRKNYHSQLRNHLRTLQAPMDCLVAVTSVRAPRPRDVTAPETEFLAVLAHATSPLRLTMLLARRAGLRVATIRALTRANVSPDAALIRTHTKFGNLIEVPTTPDLRAILAASLALTTDDEQPLVQAFGQRFSSSNTASHALTRAKRAAGLEKTRWSFHDLRRTAARQLYKATGDLNTVRRFLGHSHLGQSLWYLNAAADQTDVDKIVAALAPQPNPKGSIQ